MRVWIVLVEGGLDDRRAGIAGGFSSAELARGWLLENGYEEVMEEGGLLYRKPVFGDCPEPDTEVAEIVELVIDARIGS